MSTPSGQPTPMLRIAGVGLVVVALVLGAVGILTGNDDDSSDSTAAGPETSSAPSSTSAPAPTDGAAPTGNDPAPTAGAQAPGGPGDASGSPSAAPRSPAAAAGERSPAAQGSGGPAPAGATGGSPGASPRGGGGGVGGAGGVGAGGAGSASTSGGVDFSLPVRVYNNSTITGLASDAARDLELAGWNDVSTGNYAAGVIPTTTVYYRPGTAERTAADRIAETIGARSEERFTGLDDATRGLIVIVTQDYRS